jgi:hypothetical protein
VLPLRIEVRNYVDGNVESDLRRREPILCRELRAGNQASSMKGIRVAGGGGKSVMASSGGGVGG